MLQIRCLQELKRLQPVGRGFQVVIAEKCHISAPGINKSLKKAIEFRFIETDHPGSPRALRIPGHND